MIKLNYLNIIKITSLRTIFISFLMLLFLDACKSTINKEESSHVIREEKDIRNIYANSKRKQNFNSFYGSVKIDTLENMLILFYDSMYVRIAQNAPKNRDLFFNKIVNREVLGVSSMDTIFLQSIEDVSYIVKPKNNTRNFKITYWGTQFTHNPLFIFVSIKSKDSFKKSGWESFIKNAKLTFASHVFIQI